MASPPRSEARDPKLIEAIKREEPFWVPIFLSRAALGLSSVVVASASSDGRGAVALVSAMEASALVRKLGDVRASAKLSGTPSPGAAWALLLGENEHAVISLAMTPILSSGSLSHGVPVKS